MNQDWMALHLGTKGRLYATCTCKINAIWEWDLVGLKRRYDENNDGWFKDG